MKADSTDRPCEPMYRITWFDMSWNELGAMKKSHTWIEVVRCLEAWNRRCRHAAKDAALVVPDVDLPVHVSVEVHYVER